MNKIVDKLNIILSDALVMFVKLHNYHWNVKGMEFYSLHAKTEEMYNHFATMYDDVAERVLQLGGTPAVTLKEALARATIQEDEKTNFDASYVIKNILKDYSVFLKHFKDLSLLSDSDQTTAGYSDEQIATIEKEIWMLNSNLR